MNGQPRQVPIGDVVLIDFAGDGRNVSLEEISKVNSANGGYVVMRNGEQFNASLQDLIGKPLIAVFYERPARQSQRRRAHLYGFGGERSGFPDAECCRAAGTDTPGAESAGRTCKRSLRRGAVERAMDQHRLQRRPRAGPALRAVW